MIANKVNLQSVQFLTIHVCLVAAYIAIAMHNECLDNTPPLATVLLFYFIIISMDSGLVWIVEHLIPTL